EPAEAMPKAFCDVATGHGGQVLTHHTVKNVIVENGKAKGVVVVGRQGVEETYRAKYVVNTACYPEMRKLLGANIPKHIDDIITDLYKSDTVALDVHLGLKKKVLPNLSSQLMLVTDQMEYDGVIATFTNLDPAWAPPGKQAINAELFLSQTEYKTKTVEEWFEHMKEGVFKRWPEVKPEVEWVESFIVPSASVHQSTHAVKRLPLESGIDGLYFAGDCTVGEGVVSERAAYSARKVAKMIISREGKG
ncbi:MAG: FAD-dependent oxidoreductase, partial [Dehalococcoidia bacterium]